MVFDAEDGQLIGLDVSAQQQTIQSNIVEADDVLVFPVEQNPQVHLKQPQAEQALDLIAEPVLKAVVSEPIVVADQPVGSAIQQQDFGQTDLMPQDILKLREQVLEGEWNLEKWEYWFRNSELSPAVQELAQHGIMQGYINGSSVFHIPQKYEVMLSQLRQALEEALKSQWPNTQFNVQYQDIDSITPFTMQVMRKEKAFHRAVELLQQEPAIKSLIETFDGELQNIQLKS